MGGVIETTRAGGASGTVAPEQPAVLSGGAMPSEPSGGETVVTADTSAPRLILELEAGHRLVLTANDILIIVTVGMLIANIILASGVVGE